MNAFDESERSPESPESSCTPHNRNSESSPKEDRPSVPCDNGTTVSEVGSFESFDSFAAGDANEADEGYDRDHYLLSDGMLVFHDAASDLFEDSEKNLLAEETTAPNTSTANADAAAFFKRHSSCSTSFSSCSDFEDGGDNILLAPPRPPSTSHLDFMTNSPCTLSSTGECQAPGKIGRCNHSLYGKSNEDIDIDDMPPEGGGILWHARIVPDDFDSSFDSTGKLRNFSLKDYDVKQKCIKPRRGQLCVTAKDFFSSLVRIEDRSDSGSLSTNRWIFTGVLNGWPALQCLELIKIEFRGKLPRWRSSWDTDIHGQNFKPEFPVRGIGRVVNDVRATLRAAVWTAYGWSKESPGYSYWFEAQRLPPRLTYGMNMLRQFQKDQEEVGHASAQCEKVHMVSHRYSTGDKKESSKNKLTYHSAALLEWDHGKYCTVVEAAYLNGLGGYNGRSNWYDVKDTGVTALCKAFPPVMVAPWKENLLEIRAFDVQAKNLKEFLDYMGRHTGQYCRFLNVQCTFSHRVRLTFRSKEHIAHYLMNYIRRDRTYSEIRRNCQTFVADLCAFLAGKKDVQPFHPLNRIDYRNQKHHFLYESSLYGTQALKGPNDAVAKSEQRVVSTMAAASLQT